MYVCMYVLSGPGPPQGRGGDAGAEGTTTGPTPQVGEGRGGGYHGVRGGRVGQPCITYTKPHLTYYKLCIINDKPHTYMHTFIHAYVYLWSGVGRSRPLPPIGMVW